MDRSMSIIIFSALLFSVIVGNCNSLNVTSDNFDEEFEKVK